MQQIADICKDQWPSYGRLPSVAIAQAYVESGIFSGGRNLYGVRGCSGLGVYDATIRYLKCLNNQYFRGEGAFSLDPEYQLSVIMKGGRYCAGERPGGSYYNNCISIINRFNLDRFDAPIRKMVREEAKKRRRKERQRHTFVLRTDESIRSLTPYQAITDPDYIPKGSTIVYGGGIVEVVGTRKGIGNTIIIGKREFPWTWRMELAKSRLKYPGFSRFHDPISLKIKLMEVYEDAKG